MPTIVSRVNQEKSNITALQETVVKNSLGAVTYDESGLVKVADTMEELISQTNDVLTSLCSTLKNTAIDLAIVKSEKMQLFQRVDELECLVENLVGEVSFDEALDHASRDLMDCLCSSGAADVTSDGELAFDERLVLRKEDIKPMLQQAIIRWIEVRLAS